MNICTNIPILFNEKFPHCKFMCKHIIRDLRSVNSVWSNYSLKVIFFFSKNRFQRIFDKQDYSKYLVNWKSVKLFWCTYAWKLFFSKESFSFNLPLAYRVLFFAFFFLLGFLFYSFLRILVKIDAKLARVSVWPSSLFFSSCFTVSYFFYPNTFLFTFARSFPSPLFSSPAFSLSVLPVDSPTCPLYFVPFLFPYHEVKRKDNI